MLPRWHILYGAVFTVLIWLLAPQIAWYNLILMFLASFLIDFDHYLSASFNSKKWSLKNAFRYYEIDRIKANAEKEKGNRKQGNFHLFHTIEFYILVLIIGLFWAPLFYVFAGMVFHTLLDILHLGTQDAMYRREFFFWKWIKGRL